MLLWLAIAAAVVVFVVRGPLRSSSDYVNDFAAPYTSARLWLQHQNPYDAKLFWDEWHRSGAPSGHVYANPSSTHSVYPPPSLVVLAPLAILPWRTAWATLQLLSTALYLVSLLVLARLLPGSWNDVYRPAFLVIGLLFAPTQSALHVSNVACLSASLLFIAVSLEVRSATTDWTLSVRTFAISILVGLSLCIKLMLAPAILFYLLARRRWMTFAITTAFVTLACGVYVALQPNTNWLTSLRGNISFLFDSGVAGLPARNLTRSDRIDLQLPAYILTQSTNGAAAIAVVVSIALLAFWFWLERFNRPDAQHGPLTSGSRDGTQDRQLLGLANILVIGLLPFYQRFYSATILLLPIVWALRNLVMPKARWILALCCFFLVNTTVLPRMLGLSFSANFAGRLVDAAVTSHLCWLLLTLALLLLDASRNRSSQLSENDPVPCPASSKAQENLLNR